MIYLKEDLTEEELKKAADLIVSTIPARKEAVRAARRLLEKNC